MIVDFSTFSDLDITNSIEGVASDIAVIKRQINEAKSKAASTGFIGQMQHFVTKGLSINPCFKRKVREVEQKGKHTQITLNVLLFSRRDRY